MQGVSTKLLAARWGSAPGAPSPFAEHLLAHGERVNAEELQALLDTFDPSALLPGEEERVRTFIQRMGQPVGGSAGVGESGASTGIDFEETPEAPARPSLGYLLGQELQEAGLRYGAAQIAKALRRGYENARGDVLTGAPDAARIAADLAEALETHLPPGVTEPAGVIYADAVADALRTLMEEELPVTPRLLEAIEAEGVPLAPDLQEAAERSAEALLSRTVQQQFQKTDAYGRPSPAQPVTARAAREILQALSASVRSGGEAGPPKQAPSFAAGITAGLEALLAEGRNVSPQLLNALEAGGLTFPASVTAAALASGQKQVEEAVLGAFWADGRVKAKPPTYWQLMEVIENAIAEQLPQGKEGEETRLFSQSVAQGLQRAVDEEALVSPALLARLDTAGYGPFSKRLTDGAAKSAEKDLGKTLWADLTDSYGRVKTTAPSAQRLLERFEHAAQTLLLPRPSPKAQQALFEGVVSALERLVAEGGKVDADTLAELEAAGHRIPNRLKSAHLDSAHQEVEQAAWKAFDPTQRGWGWVPPDASALLEELTPLFTRGLTPGQQGQEAAVFGPDVVKAFTRLEQEGRVPNAAVLEGLGQVGFTFPPELEAASLSASRQRFEDAIVEVVRKDGSGRDRKKPCTPEELQEGLRTALQRYLPETTDAEQVEAHAASVAQAFGRVLAEGGEVSFDLLIAADTCLRALV